jgi:hypothetical protein
MVEESQLFIYLFIEVSYVSFAIDSRSEQKLIFYLLDDFRIIFSKVQFPYPTF